MSKADINHLITHVRVGDVKLWEALNAINDKIETVGNTTIQNISGSATPPDPFVSISVTSITYDPVNAQIVGTCPLPVTLNGFIGGTLWAAIGTSAAVQVADCPWNGTDPVFNFQFPWPLPATAQNWKLYPVSYSKLATNALTLSTPFASFTLQTGAPGNPTIDTFTISSTNDGQLATITAKATPANPLNGLVSCQVWLQDVTSGHTAAAFRTSDAFLDSTITYPYTDAISVNIVTPLPPIAETWKIWLVPDSSSTQGTFNPTTSPSFTVTVAARSVSTKPTAAPITSITVTEIDDQDMWGFLISFVLPSGFVTTCKYFQMWYVDANAIQPSRLIGTISTEGTITGTTYNFSTSPTNARPASGTERWDVMAITFNGDDVQGYTTFSNIVTIYPPNPSASGLFATSLTISSLTTPKQTIDGVTTANLYLGFVMPTNTDVSTLVINAVDLTNGGYEETVVRNWILQDGDYGTSQFQWFERPAYGQWGLKIYSKLFSSGAYAVGTVPQVNYTPNSGTGGVKPPRVGPGAFPSPMSLAAGSSLTASAVSGTVSITYDPVNGIRVTDSTNSQIAQLLDSGLKVSGSGTLAGALANLRAEFLSILGHSGNSASLTAGVIPSLSLSENVSTGNRVSISADNGGSGGGIIVNVQTAGGPNGFLNLINGLLKIAGSTMFDATGIRVLTPGVNSVSTAWTPGSAVGWEVITVGGTSYRRPYFV